MLLKQRKTALDSQWGILSDVQIAAGITRGIVICAW